MIKILKNAKCYGPDDYGIKSVVLLYDRIYRILPDSSAYEGIPQVEVYDCGNKIVCPGFIDIHVHILGGGGEQGEQSRLPEIDIEEVVASGVTTLVGVLGTDGISKDVKALLIKARELEKQGITTYIYTGSYSVPPVTATGSVLTDMVLVDKVVGVGEIAISDHRSSYPGLQEMSRIASQARIGGMLAGKPGIVHFHVGDGKDGIDLLNRLVDTTEIPMGQFLPTHINRNRRLFEQGLEYCKKGGRIDLTAGEDPFKGVSVDEGVARIIEAGIDISSVTVSSDANGSVPSGNEGAGRIKALFTDIRKCMVDRGIDPGTALKIITENPAKALGIYPSRGCLRENGYADIAVLGEGFAVEKVFAKGNLVFDREKGERAYVCGGKAL